ncbi:class I adenylate-forming enzyme family protein [Luteimonas sp. MC1828]|uniref:class I adenylate-forming enzyme family protein n=1 Tax=Luteimonas sp. MC1828 TaxID=2799787 RepID=UPI0018F1138F|nr:class I adenylate-forming enzyme family protein [Luteimonas sp. MC1828]MBJ7574512.1 acyl--CoA ligase [Luteimonas sp. MC1828]
MTARATPDAVAIASGVERLDYAGLADQVRRFAAMLVAQGIRSGERVAIVLPNSIEAVVACYGCWLAGCIAVPLAPQSRLRELHALLRHAGARMIVHEPDNADAQGAADRCDPPLVRIVPGGRPPSAVATGWDDAMRVAPLAESRAAGAMASIMYTSGTTGSPKGVTLTHANFAANVDAINGFLGLCAADSVVSVLPFHYAYGASVLHTHLAAGARVVLETNSMFPHLLVESMVRERPTGFSGVASNYALLLDHLARPEHDLSSLRYLTNAGGALPAAFARRLRAALPGAALIVMYGQTEATSRLAWLPAARLDEKPGSAGQAIAGVTLEVRNEAGAPLPPGRAGEVWAKGDNVMSGYWNDAMASAAVLHEGWLRTGDMGHLDDEGFLFLAGRRSDMIKTGAHRVHPLEVEEVLIELPGVVEAAVVGVDHDVLGQVVKAYVVGDGRTLDANAVRAHCRARLAAHKVPRLVEFASELPRTASGKVRRVELGDRIAERVLS